MIPLGKLVDAPADRVRLSPNWSTRPALVRGIELVVIHATADKGSEEGAESWMCDVRSKVSAHLHIRRDGTVVRLVADRRRAWHAGPSAWRSPAGKREEDLNRISLGWELANRNDGREPYTPEQYATAARLAVHYVRQGLPLEVFVGHSDVSPKRKTDPGPMWDWKRFRVDVISLLHPLPDPLNPANPGTPPLDRAA